MKFILPIVAAALLLPTLPSCAKDPYQDPTYRVQRNLRHRNQSWDAYQNRQRMRREARDDRYDTLFNSVME